MTRNWFAVYTRPQKAKKVASILSKKGIKTYFPENNVIGLNGNNKKICKEGLFCSYVFVYIAEPEMGIVKNISGVVNFMFWLSKPAIIKQEEIEAVKQLTSFYNNIKVEKTVVNMGDTVRIIDEPVISFKENSASIKFQTLKIVLPSLGYIMTAERDKVNELVLKQDLVQAGSFPRRLTSFFSN
jgi:transcription antitermination factor NusG